MKKNFIQFLLIFYAFNAISQSANIGEINTFVTKSGAKPTFSKATGNLNFLRFPVDKAIVIPKDTPDEKVLFFLDENKTLFPTKKGNDAFQIKISKKDNYGFDQVTTQQLYRGVPVFDGLLKFHFNKNGDLASLNGNYITIDKLNAVPSITKEVAEAVAVKHVRNYKNQIDGFPLIAKNSQLFVFQKGLVQGYNGFKHLVYEVEVTNGKNIREFVFIDAHTKEKVEQFTGIHDALDRALYNTSYNSAAPATNRVWQEGDALPGTLDVWQQSEVETAGQIYYMMKNAFGHTSYDNLDAKMITVHDDPTINCPNANWNGVTANYCTGIASDDVVAHEWGHAYTEYTNGLIYGWQSGALNESYSDIWGETVDQLNSGYFDSGEVNTPRTASCTDSDRWKMGEGTTDGALRDMYNPNCDGISPGRVLDPMYWCNSTDGGGVHINSGVHNHAYALLVDGGTYNGQTITGIGMTKAAHIFWYAQNNYITATTNFKDQADNLEDALTQLIGINLPTLSTAAGASTLSGIMISAGDLAELQKVLLAVEMREENLCGFTTLLQPLDPICAGGTDANAFYLENFEDGLTGWTTTNIGGASWTSHNWVSTTNAPKNHPGTVAFGINDNAGDCDAAFAGVLQIESPEIEVPMATTGQLNLAFDHYISTEFGYDGGNISYSINGGAYTLLPLAAFTDNGYNANLATTAGQNTNPMQGQIAFTGADGGSVSGTWGQSRVNLTSLGLDPGEKIRFRWNLGQDGCAGWDGWYIDDVRVYSCALPTVQFSVASTTVNEEEASTANATLYCLPYVEKLVTIKVNKTPSQPVTATLVITPTTATQGTNADFSVSPASVTLQAGTLSQDVLVRIYDDNYVENDETFTLTYTLNANGGDAFAETFNQSHSFTITDNDLEPGVITSEFLNERFENPDYSLPVGWNAYEGDGTTVDGTAGIYPDSWAVVSQANHLAPDGDFFLIADSDQSGPGSWDKIIETKPFNTAGYQSLTLNFVEHLLVYDGDFPEVCTVEVWDGLAWHNLITHDEAGGDVGTYAAPVTTNITIPAAYANPAMKIRFRYTADWDYYWMIDNVKVTGTLTTQVQGGVNTANPASAYLGPMGTAVFYDPTTGDLLAKIKNLSNHDYGCTTVEIDRAGAGQVPWVGVYKISAKTFKVTPANPNPTGNYEITLYYKAAELVGQVVNSLGKSNGNIASGNTGLYAGGQSGSVFNTDYSYTATFTTGFSGFGLSDAQPGAALPVKLISFDGKSSTDGNVLTWVTAEEKNNEAFVLERSDNAKDFQAITQINGKGNSKENNNYGYLDNTFSEGVNYYRLKQLDTDGKYGYSKVIALESKNAYKISISPNPIIASLNIEVPFSDEELVDFKIVSSTGTQMMNKQVKAKNGKIVEEINSLAPGLYHVILKAKNKTTNYKIIKQ